MDSKKKGFTDVFEVGEYEDKIHAEVSDDLTIGDYGYKYRVLDGVVMPPYITPGRYKISRTIATRLGDICYTSFPKSGSTWLAYILVLIVHNGETPEQKTLRNCLQWVASSYTYPRTMEELDSLPSPRIFKSHMPYEMAVGGNPIKNPCKYIYISRNPKDVAVSYYHFESGKKWAGDYNGPWEHWLKIFLEGKVQRGDWFDHVLGWWEHRDAENVLFLKYEDLLRNFKAELKRISEFLGYSLSEQTADVIQQKTSFEEMRKDRFSNMHEIKELKQGFFRKGRVGSWRDLFTVSQSDYFDKIYQERMTGGELEFEFE